MPPGGSGAGGHGRAAVKSGIQFTWGPAFFANGGGEEFIRLAYSWEPPERNYEGAKLMNYAREWIDVRWDGGTERPVHLYPPAIRGPRPLGEGPWEEQSPGAPLSRRSAVR